jgi:hypothetical protein
MAHILVRLLAGTLLLSVALPASAQEVGSRVPAEATDSQSSAPGSGSENSTAEAPSSSSNTTAADTPAPTFLKWLRGPLSQKEDPDGPINTDRPTFTPANTVVPPGRLQIESGFTYNRVRNPGVSDNLFDAPELACRYGLMNRVEFRTFWLGPTEDDSSTRTPLRRRGLGGPSDLEIGFKWQLFAGDKERPWIPTTALITSVIAPTGGGSQLSSGVAEPYINLIYGWSLSEKLTLAGSTGYLGQRLQADPTLRLPADSYQRFHQSLVAFYTVGERSTLFYEWYAFMYTNASDNRPVHYMDGGLLYRLSPNIQLDVRAGFGLSGRPDDFFTGTGLSFRF